jgi:hypothetical protein
MSRILSRLGLPLLAKELIEQAARRRTYIVRALYATLLFCLTYVLFYDTLGVGLGSRATIMGIGRKVFVTVVGLQFAGIYLLMPALTCSVITQEKERASLALLFLTRLGPWTILFEKLLSRLVPMLGFVLVSLPLLAYAYTLGGISPEQIWIATWLLLLAGFQLACIALCCSAYFRTTAGAFVWSYFLTVLLSLGPGLLIISLFLVGRPHGSTEFERAMMATGLFEHEIQFIFPFCPGFQFLAGTEPGAKLASVSAWIAVPLRSLPTLFCAALALVLARVFLVRRAFLAPRNLLLNLLRWFDRLFARLNENRLTKGIVVYRDAGDLPGDEPVAWRETARRSISRGRYIVRLLLAIELPVVVIVSLIAAAVDDEWKQESTSTLCQAVWFAAVLLVAMQAASLVPGERSRQTLEVLCATPLAGLEIVLQKYSAVRRLIRMLWVPFLTVFIYGVAISRPGYALIEVAGLNFAINPNAAFYLVRSLLSVAIYLPLVAWLSLWIGLKVRTQGRAVIAALMLLVAWWFAPLLLVELVVVSQLLGPVWTWHGRIWGSTTLLTIRAVSPISIIRFDELNYTLAFLEGQWLPVLCNFAIYALCLAALRWRCLSRANRFLGRLEGIASDTWVPPRARPARRYAVSTSSAGASRSE